MFRKKQLPSRPPLTVVPSGKISVLVFVPGQCDVVS